jgi:hypothetical protein
MVADLAQKDRDVTGEANKGSGESFGSFKYSGSSTNKVSLSFIC